MATIIMINWVSLDGVMQAPGDADEDTRGGFDLGGWAAPYSDATVAERIGEALGGDHAWLFGRRSYVDMLTSWNERGGPFKDGLNDTRKYVVSRSSHTHLGWPRSTLLAGEATQTVAELKATSPSTLVIMGSGALVRSLVGANLIDRYVLLVAPLVLGRGQTLFGGVPSTSLRLVDAVTAPSGAVVASYVPAPSV